MDKEINSKAISTQESNGFFILKELAIVCVIAVYVVTLKFVLSMVGLR